MRQFGRVGKRFITSVKIVNGPHSRAIVQRPPDIDRPGVEFRYPALTCRVDRNSLVKSGQVVQLPNGDYYLVADHSKTADAHTHHLFRCDRQVVWSRMATIDDPLTGVAKADGPVVLADDLWVMWERVRREFADLTIRVEQETHLLATGADVQLGDLIDDMRVKRVNTALGVKILELEG